MPLACFLGATGMLQVMWSPGTWIGCTIMLEPVINACFVHGPGQVQDIELLAMRRREAGLQDKEIVASSHDRSRHGMIAGAEVTCAA